MFAILIINNCYLYSFCNILSYPKVGNAVSTFNTTIECVFVFYKYYTSVLHR